MKLNETLIRHRASVGKTMAVCLLLGLVMAALEVALDKDIDWQQARLMRVENAFLRLDETGKRLLLSDGKGSETSFFCRPEYDLCAAVAAHHAGNGAATLSADVEYLAVEDNGSVMLGADYLDGRTNERVSLRYPKETVDRQAAEVEEAGKIWSRRLVPLRHFTLTVFVVLLLFWLYAALMGRRGRWSAKQAASGVEENNLQDKKD